MQGGFEAAGDIATGGVFAHAIESSAGERATIGGAAAAHRACLNCGTALTGEFCSNCGQAAHVHRTLAAIGHDLLHGVWHFEGKIWRTLPMLFTRPGALTRRYIAGERVRFVSPLALFLFSVFLMVATFETIGGPIGGDNIGPNRKRVTLTPPQLAKELGQKRALRARLVATRDAQRAQKSDTDAIDQRIDTIKDEIAQLQAAYDLKTGTVINVKKSEINTGWHWLDERLQHMLKEPKLYLYKLQSSAYKYSWALIPISLPFIWLLFAFRRDVGPYDHAIFAIYSLSAMTLGAVALSIGAAIGVSSGLIATIIAFGPPLHMYKQLRGAYGITRFGAVWRTAALLVFAFVSGFLFFAVVFGIIAG